jgi:hypothetical protein
MFCNFHISHISHICHIFTFSGMQLYSFDTWIEFVSRSFFLGYTLVALVCLFLQLFKQYWTGEEAANIQFAANLAMAFGFVISLIFWGKLLYVVYSIDNNIYEKFGPTIVEHDFDRPLLIIHGVATIIGLLFFIPRFRRSWLLSLLVLICINAEFIISFVGFGYSDYLPSAWESYYEYPWLVKSGQLLLFGLITFLLYRFLARRKKLPYTQT